MGVEINETNAHGISTRATVTSDTSTVASLASDLALLLLGMWFGAAVFFSVVVAPNVFTVLRSFLLVNANEIAGTIVTRTLSVINLGGFVIGLLLLATVLVFRRTARPVFFIIEFVSLALMTITTALGHWFIAAKMLALRGAMVIPIDHVARDNPRRVAFDRLHGYSVAALGVAVIAALVAFILIARHSRAKA